MASYKTVNSLVDHLLKRVYYITLESVQPQVLEMYRASIRENVYAVQRSGLYERTGTLLTSATANVKLNKSKIEIDIFNDEDKMIWAYPSHSPNFPNDNRDKIVEYVNYGNKTGLYHYGATNFFTQAKLDIESNIITMLKYALTINGLKVVK
jgi:hypothetical protein